MMSGADTAGGLDLILADLDRFRAFVRPRVPDADAINDVLNEAMLRATRGITSLRDSDRINTWFYGIIRHTLADRGQRSSSTSSTFDPAGVAVTSTELAAFCQCLELVFDRLPVNQAVAIRLVDIDGVEPERAAQLLGITTSALYARRQQARASLCTAFEAICQVCASGRDGAPPPERVASEGTTR